METTRERNIYTFITDNGKKVIFNTDTNEVIGASGKTVKNMPTTVSNSYMAHFLFRVCRGYNDYYDYYREIFDRVFTLPKGTFESRDRAVRLLSNTHDTELALENWKIIIDYIENPEDYNNMLSYYGGIEELVKINKSVEKARKYNLTEYIYHIFSTNCAEYLEDKIFRKTFRETTKDKFASFKQAVCELAGTTDADTLYYRYGITFRHYDINYYINQLVSHYKGLKDKLRILGMEDFTIRNIKDDYKYISDIYDKNQRETENNYFKKNQTEYDLSFENDNYKIFVPLSREELKDIGDSFHNCANGHEWNTALKNNLRKIVVVVDKETDEMVVCCDMDTKNLKIQQYLAPCNAPVGKKSLKDFRKEYQEYLKTLIGE